MTLPAWWTSHALVSLKNELNVKWPGRSKASDGFIASAAHHSANPSSDHEPRLNGEVNAFDITCAGLDHVELANYLANLGARGDRRVKYVIHDRRISNPAVEHGAWRPYTGKDPHTAHIHLSVHPGQPAGPWGVSTAGLHVPVSTEEDDLFSDEDRRMLQELTLRLPTRVDGTPVKPDADGVYRDTLAGNASTTEGTTIRIERKVNVLTARAPSRVTGSPVNDLDWDGAIRNTDARTFTMAQEIAGLHGAVAALAAAVASQRGVDAATLIAAVQDAIAAAVVKVDVSVQGGPA